MPPQRATKSGRMLNMAETASDTITIAASPDEVWAIATDLERYPEWARDVKDVVITARDDDGRPSQVEFRTSALGRSTHYTLQYDYSEAPKALAWSMVKGDIQRSIEGAYRFEPTVDGGTRRPVRPGDRARGAAPRVREAPCRAADPQRHQRDEGVRRGVSLDGDVA